MIYGRKLAWGLAAGALFAAVAASQISFASDSPTDLRAAANGWTFDRVERLGNDIMLTARLQHV